MLFHTQLHRKLNEIIYFVYSLCVSVNHKRVFSKVWVDTVRSSWDIRMVPHSADWAVHNGTTVCPHLMMFMLSLSISSYFIFSHHFVCEDANVTQFILLKRKEHDVVGLFAIWLRYLLLLSPRHEKWTTQQVWFLTKIRSDMQMDSNGGSVWKSIEIKQYVIKAYWKDFHLIWATDPWLLSN